MAIRELAIKYFEVDADAEIPANLHSPSIVYAIDIDEYYMMEHGKKKRPRTNEGSYTGTLTGVTTTVTGTIKWFRYGKTVTLLIPALTGTSNSTAATITGSIPAEIIPTTAQLISVIGNVQDNGTTTNGLISMGTNGTMTLKFGATAPSATFTNTGTKGWTAGMAVSYSLF